MNLVRGCERRGLGSFMPSDAVVGQTCLFTHYGPLLKPRNVGFLHPICAPSKGMLQTSFVRHKTKIFVQLINRSNTWPVSFFFFLP